MPRLRELQRAMRDAILDDASSGLAEHIVEDGMSAGARLTIYRENFLSAAIRALRICYPATDALVGARFFDAAAALYARRDPPRGGWLDDYGGGFAAFLADFSPAAGLRYLPDVARLEWAVGRALRSPDAPGLSPDRLAALAPDDHPRLRFHPHPSLTLLRALHPVDRIWRAVLDGTDAALSAVDLADGPVALAVQRRGDTVEVVRIDDVSWTLIAALCAGRPVGAALESCPLENAGPALAGFLADGRFIGFDLTPPKDKETVA